MSKQAISEILADGLDALTDGRGWGEDHEKARLLADAAPELLGALEDITDRFEAAIEATYATRTDRVEIRAARAAIAKATQ